MSADTPPAAEHRCGLVALIGRPNVGKSTLQNALVGFRVSIVSPKPQTTRHRILGIATRPGAQMLFVDTPGMHADAKRAINRQLNRAARGAIEEVDVLVHVVEAGRWTDEDERVWQALKAAGKPVLLAANKIDTLKNRDALLPFIAAATQGRDYAAVLLVSARRADGLKELEREIVARLPLAPPVYGEDEITDRSERFLAAELVREQLMRQLGQELPYSCTVEIEQFGEREDGVAEIGAVIWVERAGQKAIVIGAGGARLKEVGTSARLAMERLFERRVFLKLWVRVRENWSDDEAALKRFGYEG
ncbi:MAG: GTPase Era [Lysobacterales bacterium 69-70]|nr:GTPase Era [Xanthomonadaceae bacterium]ODU32008.1 MAG: GTPase Era [Xanthomonadaceae bacterium SCN 69-320]ODV20063.1 MAG: GTPase Era [Xanthomonadaceae bacterium SCN 69-25]OJZ01731.1 MAG: GTPase Era [Xanthomonadales bacterium 69-70]